MKKKKLSDLIEIVGQSNLARGWGISPAGVNKIKNHEELPYTDYLPDNHKRKTDKASVLLKLLSDKGLKYTKKQILDIGMN